MAAIAQGYWASSFFKGFLEGFHNGLQKCWNVLQCKSLCKHYKAIVLLGKETHIEYMGLSDLGV